MKTKLSTWWIGELREDLMDFRKGEPVLIVKSTKRFHCADLNPCYWLMQGKQGRIVQVSAYLYGENAYRLVSLKTEVCVSAQDKLTERAKELLQNSVYSPKGQRRMVKHMGAVYQFREKMKHAQL